MALNQDTVTSTLVKEGFNNTFSEIINCELLQPTFDDWFTNAWQFLEKRDGMKNLFSMSGDIIDYVKEVNDYYVLEETSTSDCKLRKVAKDTNWYYTVKTNLTPSEWIKYDSTYNKWVVLVAWPDVSSIKVTNSTPTNATDPTTNPYGDYSDTLKDTSKSFDNSYFNVYWVITSHSETKVASRTATPPWSPTAGDRYIVDTWGTWAWSWKDTNIAQWSWSAWVFTVPKTWYFCYSTADNLTYRFNWSAWASALIDNWWKEGTRFEVTAVLWNNELRITSPVTINNFDSYSIYGVLSNYKVFKKTGNSTTGKVGLNIVWWTAQIFSWYANTRDMVTFDWNLWWCTPNRLYKKWTGQELTATAESNFYIYDSELTCLDTTWDFILIGWTNKCYAMIRLLQNTTWWYVYWLRDITQLWLFSKKSVLTYWGSLYVCLTDRRWYWLSVTFTAQSAQVQLKDVGVKVQRYFDKMNVWDEVEWFWYNWNYWFLISWSYNALIRYNEPRQGFMIDEYDYWFNNMQLVSNATNCTYWSWLFVKSWTQDNWSDISQKIAIIASEERTGLPARTYELRIMFWFKNEPVDFKVTVIMDNDIYTENMRFNPQNTWIVLWLSSLWSGVLWTTLLWTGLLWWPSDNPYIWKFWIIGIRLWKISHLCKVVIENLNNSNFVFWRLDTIHEEADTRLVPIRNVL